MADNRETPSPGDVARTVANASVGLGILTMTFLPLSLGGVLLFVIAPVALVIAPFVLISLIATLLAAPFVLLFRIARALMARRPVRLERQRRDARRGALTGRDVAARRC